MKIHNAIIIGGGIAGLGCARTLSDHGDDDFLLVTKDIGGRIAASQTGDVNYGAFYVRSDYIHVRPFFRRTKRMKTLQAVYWHKGKTYSAVSTIVRHPFLSLRLLCLILRFNWQYQKFKKLAVNMEQIEAFECVPYLHALHTMNAYEYLERHGYGPLIDKIINPAIRASGFVNIRKVSMSDVLRGLLIFVYPAYEFVFMREKLISPFFNRILEDEVVSVERHNSHWKVTTQSGESHHGKTIVIATPIHISKQLLHLKEKINMPISVHVAHVRGRLHEKYDKADYVVLPVDGNDVCIAREPDATFLFNSLSTNYDLSQYFHKHEIIRKKYWHPALYIGFVLLKNTIDTDVYLIGDHNICGIEESFITGMYAANQILGKRT